MKCRVLLVTTGRSLVRQVLQERLDGLDAVDCMGIGKRQVIDSVVHKDFDLLITYRCPYILPQDCYHGVRLGAYNIHPTLLPKYKGQNPWEEIFRNNDSEGGVTLHKLSEEADSGEILFQQKFFIDTSKSVEEARTKADEIASMLVSKLINDLI